MQFSQFHSSWKQTEPNIQKIFVEKLDNDLMIEANQNKLEEGKRPDNGEDFKEYSNLTLIIKRQTGGFISPSGNLALKDTGDFFNSMKVNKREIAAEITATDSKTSMLIDTYGDGILDVPNEDVQPIVDEARPRAIADIKSKLGLS